MSLERAKRARNTPPALLTYQPSTRIPHRLPLHTILNPNLDPNTHQNPRLGLDLVLGPKMKQ